jgi:two-component system phosphate regulon sensor histidine kinase PhoR
VSKSAESSQPGVEHAETHWTPVPPATRAGIARAHRATRRKVAQWIAPGWAWVVAGTREGRRRLALWQGWPAAGVALLLFGTAFLTLLVLVIDRLVVQLPNPGVIYMPLLAMLAYHWSWRLGALASVLQLACVFILFDSPVGAVKPLDAHVVAQIATLAAVDVFTLLVVQLARSQRDAATHQATRAEALNVVGRSLTSELDERKLLQQIASTARELTGAEFAAFTLRPLDAHGSPRAPAEGGQFHLAAVVGVTPEQEALFRRLPLGGEGLLAPIFHHGVPVRVADALDMAHSAPSPVTLNMLAATSAPRRPSGDTGIAPLLPRFSRKAAARAVAASYARGAVGSEQLRAVGIPHGHPVVRSFLGVPLLDREGQVRGGLLLGHTAPDRFSLDDEQLLTGLAAQATVALENARLYRAAQTQAQELDAIFDSISDAIMLVDDKGTVIRENRAASMLPVEERAPHHDPEFPAAVERPNTARAAIDRVVSAAVRGMPVADTHAEVLLVDDAGEQRPFAVVAAPLRAPGDTPSQPLEQETQEDTNTGAVVVWHDMTETQRLNRERQARTQADAQRAMLQMVIDEMPGGIFLVRGPDARLVLANQAAHDVWGAIWPEGQPMSEFLAEQGVRVLSPEGQLLAADQLAAVHAVRTGEAVRHLQEVIRRPDGTTLPLLINAVTLDAGALPFSRDAAAPDEQHTAASTATDTPPDMRERGALIVMQDVTALKEAERAKDEFIAVAAHELKTPMAAVKGYTDMLRRRSASRDDDAGAEVAGALAPWQLDALETIDQAMARLVELTEDLLDVARLQAGRIELHLEPHDLVALARRVTKRLQFSTDSHTLRIETTVEHVVAVLDVRRVEQVVGNLLSNAIKYSPDGGVVTVQIREDEEHGEAILSVCDRGIGIPTDQQGRLFARFSRADNARAAGIGGTGLGLYLSRELIERHQGRIWFESVEHVGSTFSIALRLAEFDEEDAD